MKKVLITGDVHSSFKEILKKEGFCCETKVGISYKEVEAIIGNYVGLLVRSLSVDKNLIDKAKHLKFIARAGSGLEKIDVAYANSKNIKVVSSPEGNRNAVAEHSIAMMLNILNKLKFGEKQLDNFIWDRDANSGLELSAQTVGIIGFGNVGQSLAEKLKSFGCRILVYDKYKIGFNDIAGVKEVDLDFLLANSSIVSIHLPLTEETKNYVNEKFLSKLKKQSILINTSRGEMVNLHLLVDYIDKNQISGLGLDVFPKEPIKKMSEADKQALKMLNQRPNCVLTPHSAGLSRQSYVKLATVLAEKIKVIL